MIARAIARSIEILPVSFIVCSEEEVSLLWKHPNAFVMGGEGVPTWKSDLEKFGARVVNHRRGIVDLIVDSAASGMRLRAIPGDVLRIGADDDQPALDEDLQPLPRENLAAFFEEGLNRNSSSFIIESLTPPDAPLEALGHPSRPVLRKVFREALILASEKPVADFVASLPDAARTAIATISRSTDGTISQPLDLDSLIRCAYVVGDLNERELGDLQQAMDVVPLVRGMFSAFASPSSRRFAEEFEIDFEVTPALKHLDDFREAIVGRRSAHKALAVFLGHLTSFDAPIRPATLRALVHRAALPPIEMIYGLDAYHRTFPKAPGCTLGEFGHLTDGLFHLQVEDFLDGNKLTDLAAAIAPTLRVSQSGLTLAETKQAYNVVSWIADCLETLADDECAEDHSPYGLKNAAYSILFTPKITPARLRSIIERWHLAIDGYETAAFTAEISCARFREKINGAKFPHFLKGAATVDYQGTPATVTPITTAEGLLAEGREMRNCVSSLRYAAASGYSLLVSITTESARSNAEFRPIEDGYELVRHEGPNSSEPDPIHAQIVRSLEEAALSAPYAREMLPTLLELSKIEELAPADFMSEEEHRAYKDLIFRQLRNVMTPSEGKLTREIWTTDLLPLHIGRFRDPSETFFQAPPPFIERFLRAIASATDATPWSDTKVLSG